MSTPVSTTTAPVSMAGRSSVPPASGVLDESFGSSVGVGTSLGNTMTRTVTLNTRHNSISVHLPREPDTPPQHAPNSRLHGKPAGGGSVSGHARNDSNLSIASGALAGTRTKSVTDAGSINSPVRAAATTASGSRSGTMWGVDETSADDSADQNYVTFDVANSGRASARSNANGAGATVSSSASGDDAARRTFAFAPKHRRWIFPIAPAFELFFTRFDDAIIRWVQSPLAPTAVPASESAATPTSAAGTSAGASNWLRTNSANSGVAKFIKTLALFLTFLTSIELGVGLPFALHLVGRDTRATQATMLVLVTCVLSQLPKRFVWRARPWMAGRAIAIRTDRTSSFPSRAVTCSVVYGYMIAITAADANWNIGAIGVGIVCMALLSSWSRVVLGAHYPSDCLCGALMGTIICIVAHVLFNAEAGYCESCATGACYAVDSAHALRGFGGVSGVTLTLCLLLACAACVLSMSPPVHFWVKGQFVYGMLLSCVTFRLCALCPTANHSQSLAPPLDISAGTYVLAIAVAALASSIGLLLSRVKGAIGFAVFCILYVSVLVILMYWRLSH